MQKLVKQLQILNISVKTLMAHVTLARMRFIDVSPAKAQVMNRFTVPSISQRFIQKTKGKGMNAQHV